MKTPNQTCQDCLTPLHRSPSRETKSGKYWCHDCWSPDITGNIYEELTAIRFDQKKDGETYWIFRCSCGAQVSLRKGSVTTGNTSRCQTCYRPNLHSIISETKRKKRVEFFGEILRNYGEMMTKRQKEIVSCLASGMTQAETAKHLGIGQPCVQKAINGKNYKGRRSGGILNKIKQIETEKRKAS